MKETYERSLGALFLIIPNKIGSTTRWCAFFLQIGQRHLRGWDLLVVTTIIAKSKQLKWRHSRDLAGMFIGCIENTHSKDTSSLSMMMSSRGLICYIRICLDCSSLITLSFILLTNSLEPNRRTRNTATKWLAWEIRTCYFIWGGIIVIWA
jgi:hypothetical protein